MQKKYVGKIVGNYEILEKTSQKDKSGHIIYKGKCIHCGTVSSFPLRSVYSMGKLCSHFDRFGSRTHFYNNDCEKNIVKILNCVKSRCYDKQDKCFRWYGGKGIKICEEWVNDTNKFVEWALQNGYQKGLTIDRIDSEGDYEPNNCRWITREENSRRAGKVNWITINNETLTGRQWSKRINQGINFVNRYIKLYGLEKTIDIIKAKLIGELV